MEALYVFLSVIIVLIYLTMVIPLLRNENKASNYFGWFITSLILLSFGTALEILSTPLDIKVFYRNIQQIGYFLLPYCFWIFVVEYTENIRLRNLNIPFLGFSLFAIIMFLTDDMHGLINKSVELVEHEVFGKSVSVGLSDLGVSLYYIQSLIILAAFAVLVVFIRKAKKDKRKNLMAMVFSFLFCLLLSWIKGYTLEAVGIYLPIAIIYAPTVFAFYRIISKEILLDILPIARNRVFEVINDGIFVVTREGRIIDFNQAAKFLSQYFFKVEELKKGDNIFEVMNHLLPENLSNLASKQIRVSSESEYFLSASAYSLTDHSREKNYVVLIKEITETKRYEHYLIEKSMRDPLTGLLNREGYLAQGKEIISRLGDSVEVVSCILIDIDWFKKVNDTYGHHVGDELLRLFSKELLHLFRKDDVVVRIGGEEFLVLLPTLKKENAFKVAERLRKSREQKVLDVDGNSIEFTISMGVSDSIDSPDLEEMYKLADAAMYRSKKSGRNKTTIY